MMGKRIICIVLSLCMLFAVASCSGNDDNGGGGGSGNVKNITFVYDDVSYTPTIGNKVYQASSYESVDGFDDVTVNPVTGARSDFAKGVDASMIDKIEKLGGVYYNAEGKQQDVFQILAGCGVNFFRVRVWNKPQSVTMQEYGGGAVNVKKAIAMAKRAKAVGMNVFVSFHYSDIWADTEYQLSPRDWALKTKAEIPAEVETFTYNSLKEFADEGVRVDMVQIGNEINYGMFYDKDGKIDWTTAESEKSSFEFISQVLKAGIAGAKRANENVYTVVHLANGTTFEEFDTYLGHLKDNNVDYDIVGATYYSYYDGTTEALEDCFNKITDKYGKHVMVVETAYAHSDNQSHPMAQNLYTAAEFEDKGGYVTGVQGQASFLRDVMQAVANVDDDMGLGVFYWEPGWLPIEGATVDVSALRESTLSSYSQWANQGLFSYDGRVLPSIKAFEAVGGTAQAVTETYLGLKYATTEITLNKAENEQMPETYPVTGSQGRYVQCPITWNSDDLKQLTELGSGYTVRGTVEGYTVTATVNVIENFVRDSSFEGQGESIGAPWNVSYTPTSSKIVKIERKNNPHSGAANANWWHNGEFEATVWQEISGLEDGTYRLSLYIQGENPAKGPYDQLYMFVRDYESGAEQLTADIILAGWMKWQTPSIEFTVTGGKCTVGIYAKASVETWAHIDDFLLVKV